MDNKKDVAIIDTATKQKAMGVAVAKGILKTLGVKWVENKPKENPTTSGNKKLYRVQVGAYADLKNAEEMLEKLKSAGIEGIIV